MAHYYGVIFHIPGLPWPEEVGEQGLLAWRPQGCQRWAEHWAAMGTHQQIEEWEVKYQISLSIKALVKLQPAWCWVVSVPQVPQVPQVPTSGVIAGAASDVYRRHWGRNGEDGQRVGMNGGGKQIWDMGLGKG